MEMEFLNKNPSKSCSVAMRVLTDDENFQKVIHIVRHAEGEHNVVGRINVENYCLPEFEDAALSKRGMEECMQLSESIFSSDSLMNTELVVVSPLRRALQTATLSFSMLRNKVPWIALECIRELIGRYPCNRRLPTSLSAPDYPHINFDQVSSNEDILYTPFREPISEIHKRCEEFLQWISARTETHIIVVSHSELLYHLMKTINHIEDQSYFHTAEIRSYFMDFRALESPLIATFPTASVIKRVHFIRHGEGEHNVAAAADPGAYLSPEFEDAILTERGKEQCEKLKAACISSHLLKNPQLVVVSPLRRTLQTATIALPFLMEKVPWIALESVREVTGLNRWDKRRPVSMTAPDYPHVTFDEISSDDDPLFDLYTTREPTDKVCERCQDFLDWLGMREEKEVIVVTHASLLRTFFGNVVKSVGNMVLQYENAEWRTFMMAIPNNESTCR